MGEIFRAEIQRKRKERKLTCENLRIPEDSFVEDESRVSQPDVAIDCRTAPASTGFQIFPADPCLRSSSTSADPRAVHSQFRQIELLTNAAKT